MNNNIRSPLNMLPPYHLQYDKIPNQEGCPQYIEYNNNKENLSLSFMSKKRGPYKRYSPSKKKEALDIFYSRVSDDNGMRSSTKKISKSLDIPCNTLKRWIKVGIYRRKGAGRKLMDPRMVERLACGFFKEVQIGRFHIMKKLRDF